MSEGEDPRKALTSAHAHGSSGRHCSQCSQQPCDIGTVIISHFTDGETEMYSNQLASLIARKWPAVILRAPSPPRPPALCARLFTTSPLL